MTPSSEIETPHEPRPRFETGVAWKGGALAGALATIATGIVITILGLDTLRIVIAGLYGQSGSLVTGWIAHVVHGTLFGVIFAGILTDPGLFRLADWRWKTVLAGLAYGLVLAIVGAGIIMPIWLAAAGFPEPPTMPHVTAASLLWHGIYGVVLGAIYPSVASH